ncbi:MAG: hypothetical protein JO131_03275, partial [Gammaproteobacteria bacterium]|nr:hypothetical protein [Gammaproteobacteria bacterium]
MEQKGQLLEKYPALVEIQKFAVLAAMNNLTVTPFQLAGLLNNSGITFDNTAVVRKDEKERNLARAKGKVSS